MSIIKEAANSTFQFVRCRACSHCTLSANPNLQQKFRKVLKEQN